jgi:hypothetical protein
VRLIISGLRVGDRIGGAQGPSLGFPIPHFFVLIVAGRLLVSILGHHSAPSRPFARRWILLLTSERDNGLKLAAGLLRIVRRIYKTCGNIEN